MAADRDTACRQKASGRRHLAAAFDFHHLGTGRHQLGGVAKGQFRAFLIGCKGHVGNDQWPVAATGNAGDVVHHVGLRYWQCRVMSLQDHAQRVTDEQGINAAGLRDTGKGGVVAGQHDDLFTAFALADQIEWVKTADSSLG